jgi:hypothetical protein
MANLAWPRWLSSSDKAFSAIQLAVFNTGSQNETDD